jgi:glucose/arabinose dehydrogenase/PKD repeat protein
MAIAPALTDRSSARRFLVAGLALLLAGLYAPAMRGQGDVTPPTVTAQSPSPGATGVSTLIVVRAAFSEPIQSGTLVMQLRNSSNQLLAAAVTYDPATRTASLDPAAELAGSQTFTATVSGTRDLAGNLMTTVNWSFTTGTAGFQDVVLPQTGLVDPTVIQFAADGRLFVAEKSGRIYVFDTLADTTPTLVIDLRTAVHNFWDRGLLGMTLHPQFPSTPYIYVLYAHDAFPGGTAPQWGTAGQVGDPCPTPPGATGNGCVVTGRLSRLNVGNSANWPLDAGDEQVLVTDWFQQFPSHSTGSLAFGADGALYATAGDGASFNYADNGQTASTPSANDPAGEGGALRSQDIRTSGDPVTLDGSVIRIDPNTGAALPDNPRFASDSDANGKRIVAHGLRNPFRFTFRPGTDELWIGDVGWNTWEEINRIVDGGDTVVENLGWPCFEGAGTQSGYQPFGICQALPANAVTPPYYTYNHSAQVVSGEACPTGSSSIAGLAFYPDSGGSYPDSYNGALFFADYSRNCIWAMRKGTNGLPDPANRVTIRSGGGGPVNLVSGPGGDIFYPGYDDDRLHRLTYVSGNLPPTAVAQADRTSGAAPLTVNFNGSASSDPEGLTLTYAWDLDGDGAFDDSAAANPSFTYASSGTITVRLRVTDNQGLADVAALVISVNNTPPTATIATPQPSFTWKVGDPIAFSGSASDQQDGSLPASALTWSVIMHHCPSNCHTHDIQQFAGVASGTFAAPDHEYPSHLELRLTATDSGGLQHTASVLIQPQTVTLTFQSSPAGLQLAVNGLSGATPFTRTVIIGSSNSLSAPSPQTVGQTAYSFASWSDGGAQVHNVTAPASAATYTATYVQGGAPGLVAAYAFSEGSGATTLDATGNGHTGAIVGATWTTAGKNGNALSFNGTSNLVSIADAADLDFTTALTLEAWVRPTTLSGWRTVFLKEAPGGMAYALYAHDNAPRPAGYLNTGGLDVDVPGSAALALNTWSHLALTYDGANMRLYVNGTQVGTRALTGGVRTTANPLNVGGNNVWGEYFAGQIDDVRVYNRALGAGEIANDMNVPVGGTPPPDTTPPTVAISSPAGGALVRGTVTISATASDNSGTVASVQFFVDGAALGAPDTAAPFTASWTTSGSGPHTLTARATDAAGNATTSAPVSVTVDNTPPAVSVDNPSGGTVSGTITVTGSAADGNGIASVQFLADGSAIGAADTTSPYSVSWNTSAVSNGTHTLTAVATDAAGNQTTSAPRTVTVSNTWTVPSGLVAAYTFAEGAGGTTADVSGNGNIGTLVGGTAWSTAGRFGRALSFDGVNDLVSIADAAALDLTTGLTIEAWVNPSVLSGWRTIALKGAPGGMAYALYAHDEVPRPAGYVNTGGADLSAAGTAGLPTGTWTHVALTFGAGTLRLYVNGVQVGTRAVTGAIRTSADPLTLGGNAPWGEWFSGLLDEVRIYNRALTQAEIQAGMTQTVGGG